MPTPPPAFKPEAQIAAPTDKNQLNASIALHRDAFQGINSGTFNPKPMTEFPPVDSKLPLLDFGGDGPKELRVVGVNKSFIDHDKNGRINSIDYGDANKVRNFGYDSSGQLNQVTTVERGKDGSNHITSFERERDTGKWYTEVDGLKAYLPGKIELRNNGDLAVEQTNGNWHVEGRDSKVNTEHVAANGAHVSLDNDKVKNVIRTDGSSVDCQYDKAGNLNQVSEDKGGKTTTWTKDGDSWKSDGKPTEQRKEMTVDNDGNLKYTDSNGKNHWQRGDGSRLDEGEGKQKFDVDAQGRVTSLTRADGTSVQNIKYEGDTNNVSQVTIKDTKNNRSTTYTKQGDSDDWTCTDGNGKKVAGDWHGKIQVGKDGDYRYMETAGNTAKPDGMWHVYDKNGKETHQKLNQDGSVLVYDQKNQLQTVERPNGSSIDCLYNDKGEFHGVRSTTAKGEKTEWQYENGKWTSPGQPDQKDCPISGHGSYKVTDANGAVSTTNTDGSADVAQKDGTQLRINPDGQIGKVTGKNGHERNFNYGGQDGKELTSITDSSKAGATTIENGKDGISLKVSSDGSYSYKQKDGTTVDEKADFSRVEHDATGRLTAAKTDNGSRTFEYEGDSKTPTAVVDHKIGKDGKDSSERWVGIPQSDGSLSLAMQKPNGEVKARHHVSFDDSGNYKYLDKSGEKEARLDRVGRSTDSPDVDDARDQLLETARVHMDDTRYTAFQQSLKDFEQRNKDIVEMRQQVGMDANDLQKNFDKEVSGTYNQLNKLMSTEPADAPNAVFDQDTRTKLAENFMFHAADPTTIDQGRNGTCWIESGATFGMVDHPDDMARLLTDASLTGQYTPLNNGIAGGDPHPVKFNPSYLRVRPGSEESRWSPSSSTQNAGRSPVMQIFDNTLPIIGGRHYSRDYNGNETFNYGGSYGGQDGAQNIMHMVTNDYVADSSHLINGSAAETLIKQGAYITYQPDHMLSRQLQKQGDHWVVIQNEQHGPYGDREIGQVTNIQDYMRTGRSQQISRYHNRLGHASETNNVPFGPSKVVNGNNNTNDDNDYTPTDNNQTFFRRRGGLLRRIFGD